MLVLPNVFAAEDAEGVAVDPNSPPAGVEVEVFVWPKRPPGAPLVAGVPKENELLDFAGSDMVFEKGAVGLGLGNLLGVDLRRGILGL